MSPGGALRVHTATADVCAHHDGLCCPDGCLHRLTPAEADEHAASRVIAAQHGGDTSLTLRIVRAWTEPGTHPTFHEQEKMRLRKRWPVLADALDAATREQRHA